MVSKDFLPDIDFLKGGFPDQPLYDQKTTLEALRQLFFDFWEDASHGSKRFIRKVVDPSIVAPMINIAKDDSDGPAIEIISFEGQNGAAYVQAGPDQVLNYNSRRELLLHKYKLLVGGCGWEEFSALKPDVYPDANRYLIVEGKTDADIKQLLFAMRALGIVPELSDDRKALLILDGNSDETLKDVIRDTEHQNLLAHAAGRPGAVI
ncbi:MAG: hypothetical protein AAF988_08730 [Pseudomonadota bacterium]